MSVPLICVTAGLQGIIVTLPTCNMEGNVTDHEHTAQKRMQEPFVTLLVQGSNRKPIMVPVPLILTDRITEM